MNTYIYIHTYSEHLVERGFLNPSFLTKIKTDPQEILRFIRQNRAVVGDQLNRRLDPTIRPKPEQLERLGTYSSILAFVHSHTNITKYFHAK